MLEFKNFGIKYNKSVFENVSVCINPGQLLLICGKSGCGKSTLLKALNGILFEEELVSTSGDILYNNTSILKKSITEQSAYVSTVFQNPKTQFFCINTKDELALALENRNVERDLILEKIDEYTKLLKTTEFVDRNIFTLSGGEKQAVAITAVSMMNNEIYLFDEPSASLDKEAIQRLKNMIEILKKLGKIVIVAEHRLYYLFDSFDKLAILTNSGAEVYLKEELSSLKINKLSLSYCLRTFYEHKEELTFCEKKLIEINTGKNYIQEGDLLQCDNFKLYYNHNKILDLSLSFSVGINFIIGDNGIGKTSFVKKLSSLIKGKGCVRYKGKKLKKINEYISIVMQDVNYQLFTESVWDEISIVSDDEALKTQTLKDLNLYDKKEEHPQVLSGGEKQRLLISLSIVSNKPIVILDEPTSGLCKENMLKIISYLRKMTEMQKIIIIITHDYEFIKNTQGRVYEFKKAKNLLC